MSSHVPKTMTRQRNSGVLASVASADRHQQTRRAMEASRSESFSFVSTLFRPIPIQKQHSKTAVDGELLRCRQASIAEAVRCHFGYYLELSSLS
jgi:hypothetical protein